MRCMRACVQHQCMCMPQGATEPRSQAASAWGVSQPPSAARQPARPALIQHSPSRTAHMIARPHAWQEQHAHACTRPISSAPCCSTHARTHARRNYGPGPLHLTGYVTTSHGGMMMGSSDEEDEDDEDYLGQEDEDSDEAPQGVPMVRSSRWLWGKGCARQVHAPAATQPASSGWPSSCLPTTHNPGHPGRRPKARGRAFAGLPAQAPTATAPRPHPHAPRQRRHPPRTLLCCSGGALRAWRHQAAEWEQQAPEREGGRLRW